MLTLTVQELIDILQQYPTTAEVYFGSKNAKLSRIISVHDMDMMDTDHSLSPAVELRGDQNIMDKRTKELVTEATIAGVNMVLDKLQEVENAWSLSTSTDDETVIPDGYILDRKELMDWVEELKVKVRNQ